MTPLLKCKPPHHIFQKDAGYLSPSSPNNKCTQQEAGDYTPHRDAPSPATWILTRAKLAVKYLNKTKKKTLFASKNKKTHSLSEVEFKPRGTLAEFVFAIWGAGESIDGGNKSSSHTKSYQGLFYTPWYQLSYFLFMKKRALQLRVHRLTPTLALTLIICTSKEKSIKIQWHDDQMQKVTDLSKVSLHITTSLVTAKQSLISLHVALHTNVSTFYPPNINTWNLFNLDVCGGVRVSS